MPDHPAATDHLAGLARQLGLTWVAAHAATELLAAKRTPAQLLERLLRGELDARFERRVERRLKEAHLPVLKTLDQFDFTWPKNLDAEAVRGLFRLDFLATHRNVVFIGGVGLGKTHLASALAAEACRRGHHVRFATAATIVNDLAADDGLALSRKLRRYLAPDLLVVDELGYLPIDRHGADLLFQVFSGRYEHAATLITTNRAYRDWPTTFANDAGLTAAILDRLLHHCTTIVIDGQSYRMRQPAK